MDKICMFINLNKFLVAETFGYLDLIILEDLKRSIKNKKLIRILLTFENINEYKSDIRLFVIKETIVNDARKTYNITHLNCVFKDKIGFYKLVYITESQGLKLYDIDTKSQDYIFKSSSHLTCLRHFNDIKVDHIVVTTEQSIIILSSNNDFKSSTTIDKPHNHILACQIFNYKNKTTIISSNNDRGLIKAHDIKGNLIKSFENTKDQVYEIDVSYINEDLYVISSSANYVTIIHYDNGTVYREFITFGQNFSKEI